ncbi:uncharacterized protein LOC108906484 [Anoplophora glabripennis]|uniref:uncharacterized protein LOC108906484 n=1 Tax=Anoplophora glabripennis TaxID=217634 RepID=UPI0008751E16|nr:uncharacterized protein LOC108906484 [Anoplophora glabripennis]
MYFCIVEFCKRYGAVEFAVVPLLWITKKGTKCYWPSSTNKKPLHIFVQTFPLPNKNWRQYKIEKIHFKTESYPAAERELDKIITEVEDIISASNASTETSVIRKRTLSTDVSDSSDNEDNPIQPSNSQQSGSSTAAVITDILPNAIHNETEMLNINLTQWQAPTTSVTPNCPSAIPKQLETPNGRNSTPSALSETLSSNVIIDDQIFYRSSRM